MQLWKCFLVGALVVVSLCAQAHSKPTEDPLDEDYLGDEDDYNSEYKDEETALKDDNLVQLPQPTMEKTWASYNASVGDQVAFVCPIKNKGLHTIFWYRGETMLAQDSWAMNDKYKVDADFRLIIPKVMASDEGEYTCKVITAAEELLSSCKLNVAQPPNVKITDGHRDIMDRTMTYKEGDKIRLVCEANGYPRPSLSWDTKHNRLKDLSGVIVNKGDLIIESAEPQHAGIYECHAENDLKQISNASVHVVIEYTPKVLTHRPEVNAIEGGRATLYCNYHSNPEGRAQWLRNGHVLEQGDKYSFHVEEKSRHMRNNLKINKIEMEDLGQYTCEVTNKLGKNNINVTLMYEPEMAEFQGSELQSDDFTNLRWTVNSAQPLTEVDLYYKKLGDKHWRQVRPMNIDQLAESGSFSIVHKVKLSRGVWYTKLRTKNSFGVSKMSAEHEVTVVTSESVQSAGILSIADNNTSGAESISRTPLIGLIVALFLLRL